MGLLGEQEDPSHSGAGYGSRGVRAAHSSSTATRRSLEGLEYNEGQLAVPLARVPGFTVHLLIRASWDILKMHEKG